MWSFDFLFYTIADWEFQVHLSKTFRKDDHFFKRIHGKKGSEYDKEMPQSQTPNACDICGC